MTADEVAKIIEKNTLQEGESWISLYKKIRQRRMTPAQIKRYYPKFYRTEEKRFTHEVVIPQLEKEGGKIIAVDKPLRVDDAKSVYARPDIIVLFDPILFVAEVKYPTKQTLHHILQTGLGQLLIYKYLLSSLECNEVGYPLIIPKEYIDYIEDDLNKFLTSHSTIKILGM
jgi:hypothetical protein